ncbi:MAG: sugar phosphate nucleotidyltransferase, partial [bacterium]
MFQTAVETASRAAANLDAIVTFGIEPTFPSTGYGYIDYVSDSEELFNGSKVYRVEQFKEKPDRATAEQYLNNGGYLWNSGMFFWSAKRILQEVERYMPKLHKGIQNMGQVAQEHGWSEAMEEYYGTLPSQSVDYGILERSDRVWTLPVSFDWNDLGTWDAIAETFDANEDGNVILADSETVESSDSVVVSDTDHFIGTVGVDDVIVVHTEDATL